MSQDVLTGLQSAIQDFVTNPKFWYTLLITLFIADSLYEVKAIDVLYKQYNKLICTVIGAVFGLFLIEMSLMGFIGGILAGWFAAMSVTRLDIWFAQAGGTTPDNQ